MTTEDGSTAPPVDLIVGRIVWLIVVSSSKLSAPFVHKCFASLRCATNAEKQDRFVYGWGDDVVTQIERFEIQ